MQITKVVVDFVFEGEQAFTCRYERLITTRNYSGVRTTTKTLSKAPVIGRVLPSGSVQLYEGEPGSMGKVGGAIKRHLLDFSGAINQSELSGR